MNPLATEPNELWRTLGGIERALETITRTLAEDRLSTASYRTDIRAEFKATREETLNMRGELRMVADEIADLKPRVTELWDQRQQITGAHKFASVMAKILSALFGAAGGVVAVWASHWWSGAGTK